jgi:hypothetical protein
MEYPRFGCLKFLVGQCAALVEGREAFKLCGGTRRLAEGSRCDGLGYLRKHLTQCLEEQPADLILSPWSKSLEAW